MTYSVSTYPSTATEYVRDALREFTSCGRRVRANKIVYVEFKDGTSAVGPAGRFDWRDKDYGPVRWANVYEKNPEVVPERPPQAHHEHTLRRFNEVQ